MPYFLDGNCVMQGTKANPQGTVKCHKTHQEALDHLRALEVNVPDAHKGKGELLNIPDKWGRKRLPDET